MRMLIGGTWRDGENVIEVRNPYDDELIGTVPDGRKKDAQEAIESALEGYEEMKSLSSYERSQVLRKISKSLEKKREEFAQLLSSEVGKTIREARGEVDRAIQTFILSSEEAKNIRGETVPMDAAPGTTKRIAFYVRIPVGVIGAITPFNFPLNLTAHKLGPAFAAGNSVVLKPPSAAPLTVLELSQIIMEAGLPQNALNVVTGRGDVVGMCIVRDSRLRMITFTGSLSAGAEIAMQAGIKKISLELGSNSAVIVLDDADMNIAVHRIVTAAYAVAGQVCISVQRIFVHKKIWDDFLGKFLLSVESLKIGNQLNEKTDMGPMISEEAAQKAEKRVREAVRKGAKVLVGGKRDRTLFQPTVLTDVTSRMEAFCEEMFAPVVTLTPFSNMEQAIGLVNNSKYGLQVGIYTRNINRALKAAMCFEVGGVMINDVPAFRVDLMPYGGVKGSGIGREGPRYAIEEMTEIKLICFNLQEV